MDMRDYQRRAFDAVWKGWERDARLLAVKPTGTGKTIFFSHLAAQCIRTGGRVLILAHRDELIRQAQAKLMMATGIRADVEKAEERASRLCRCIVASVQTLLSPERRERIWRPTHIIVDEAHHVLSPSYQTVLGHWPESKVLGVTATPDRGDLRSLGEYFDDVCFEYSLPQAIQDGWLAPIRVQTVPLRIEVGERSGGDYSAQTMADALEPLLPDISREIAHYGAQRKTLIFAPLCATARKIQAAVQAAGLRCYYCDGEDRSEIAGFEADGPGSAMVNAMLLTEGYDHPSIDMVVVLRNTSVRALYAQMIGRGTRLSDGKDCLQVLDFLWMSKRHDLCRPAHLVCDNEEVAQAMIEQMERQTGGPCELDEAALLEAQQEVVAKREAALAKKLVEMRRRKRELVDPIQYASSIQSEGLLTYEPVSRRDREPITAEQVKELERQGIYPADIMTTGHAQAVLDQLARRKAGGFASPKMIRELEKRGCPHAGILSQGTANVFMKRIRSNGWRTPDTLRNEWDGKSRQTSLDF